MLWIVMADAVAAFHAAYIAFVVVGLAAILAGSVTRWRWVRNPYFRLLHLAAILFVCLEAVVGARCPLTTLESELRLKTGQSGYARDFVGYWFDRFIFHHAPPWAFATAYFSVGALTLLSLLIVPMRSFHQKWAAQCDIQVGSQARSSTHGDGDRWR